MRRIFASKREEVAVARQMVKTKFIPHQPPFKIIKICRTKCVGHAVLQLEKLKTRDHTGDLDSDGRVQWY